MSKIVNKVRFLFKKHFVKHEVHWVQSILIIPLTHDGKMVLHIERTSKDGIIDKSNIELDDFLSEENLKWLKNRCPRQYFL